MKLAVLSKPTPMGERQILGTVGEIDGFDHLDFNATNLMNTDTTKKVFCDVIAKDGSVIDRLYCSGAVSTGLRDKTISKANLLALPIVVATRDDGSKFNQIQNVNSESTTFSVSFDGVAAVAPVRKKVEVTWEELIG